MNLYVSTLIENENKFLLVRENKKQCYGKWNIPSGHIEENEYIFDAAIREVKEETNLDVELDGIISIYNNMFEGFFSISFVFSSKIKNFNFPNFDKNEIMEIKWFSFSDIKNMKEELRDKDYIINVIDKYNNKNIQPLSTIVTR